VCGIAGIVDFRDRPVDSEELEAMGCALAHRGPDGRGLFLRRNVGLAHRRLAIIDPRTGDQPLHNDDGTVVLSYNGEIYNYLELRRELEPEFRFRTQSDSEVLLRAFEKWGISCLERLRGMFAFSLYDARSDRLFLVRDRVGIKPLFYYRTPERLVFASEIPAILRAKDVAREILPESLSQFFRYQYVPTPATIYRNCFKLEPGHYLEVDTRQGRVTQREYWRLAVRLVERSETDWLEELNQLLDDTMAIYVRSDVPFGAFLSGGVDSSLVSALMSRRLNEPVRTFSIGFQEEVHSELPFAAEASRHVKSRHTEKIVSSDLAEEVLARLVGHFGEPFADSSAIPTYYVSQEAAGQVKMVLSGDGGDELFGGYNSYQTTFRTLNSRGPLDLLGRHGPNGIRKWAHHRLRDRLLRQHLAQRHIFDDSSLRALLAPGLPVVPPVAPRIHSEGPAPDAVTAFQAQDFETYLVDDVLTKVDRMSMASSLEVRVPLLDHRVVELAFSLPLALKLRFNGSRGVVTKYLLKRSAARFFPESFLARPKQGFGIPVREWCSGPLRPLIETELRDPKAPAFDWVRYGYVQSMLSQFFAGRGSLVARVWFVLMLDLWLKHVHLAP
jgi:asparagine synthase (glutamine-hydrolysing)